MKITDETLMRVRAGEISFNTFARATAGEFKAFAIHIFRKHRNPGPIDLDDVVQEMMLTAFLHVGQWRESAGCSIKSYVMFKVGGRARDLCKWGSIHRRMEEQTEPPCDEIEAFQDLEVEVLEKLRDLPQTKRQVVVLNSVFETQCVVRTTDELLRDPCTRAMFGGDRESVRRGVYRIVSSLTQRAQGM